MPRIPGLKRFFRLADARRRLDLTSIDDELRFHLDSRVDELIATGVPERDARRSRPRVRRLAPLSRRLRLPSTPATTESCTCANSSSPSGPTSNTRRGRCGRSPALRSSRSPRLRLASVPRRPCSAPWMAYSFDPSPTPTRIASSTSANRTPRSPGAEAQRHSTTMMTGLTGARASPRWESSPMRRRRSPGAAIPSAFRSRACHRACSTYSECACTSGGRSSRRTICKGPVRSWCLRYDYWRSRFGGDPSIVGQTITLNGVSALVVGVMQEGFNGPDRLDRPMWTNFISNPLNGRGGRSNEAYGLLRPGITVARAQAEMTRVAADLAALYPKDNQGETVIVDPLATRATADVARPLYMLLGASFVVLLIACANLSNLLLARGVSRSREIAVRSALGAGRRRIARQLLTESLLLAALGAGIGVAIAAGGQSSSRGVRAGDVRDASAGIECQRGRGVDRVVVHHGRGVRPASGAAHGAARSTSGAARGRLARRGDSRLASRRACRRATVARRRAAVGERTRGQELRACAARGARDSSRPSAHGVARLAVRGIRQPQEHALLRQVAARLEQMPGIRNVAATSLVPFGGSFDRVGITQIAGEPDRVGAGRPPATDTS